LQIAAALDWQPIDGIQAMIEQGYAQQRMWEKGDTSEETGSDPTILGREIEQTARDLANNMPEYVSRSQFLLGRHD
jgi:quinate dehydrogenase